MTAPDGGDIRLRLAGRFGDLRLDCEATIPGTGLTALVGPTGAGKTTLLRCLAGLVRAEGFVVIGEQVWQDGHRFVPVHRRGVGYVFQDASLLPHLTVSANLAFARRRAPAGTAPAFDEVVEMLGVTALLGRAPDKLSGGERQRVAIARTLLSGPRLLLMDEPLSSLDAASKAEVMPYLEALHRRLRLPVVYVSHDAGEVARLADRVMRMTAGRLMPAALPTLQPEDQLAGLDEGQVRALARAALLAGLAPPTGDESP
jgi:molybdate transport system ATP-binding protein